MVYTVQKLNSKILVTWGDWDLVTSFGTIGPKMVYLAYFCNHLSDFHKQTLILFKGLQGFLLNQIIRKF